MLLLFMILRLNMVSKYLFGEDLAEKVDKQNKEQRLMKKISVDSFMSGSRPNQTFYTWIRSNRRRGGGQKKHPNQVYQKSCFKEERRSAPETVQSSSEDLTQR